MEGMNIIYGERALKNIVFMNDCEFQGIIYFLYAEIIDLLAFLCFAFSQT